MVCRLYDSSISLGSVGCRAVRFSLGCGCGFSILDASVKAELVGKGSSLITMSFVVV